jgi:hypothetical protein
LNSRERSRSAATASARRNSSYSNDTTKKQPPSTRESKEADSTTAIQLRGASNHRMDLRTRQGGLRVVDDNEPEVEVPVPDMSNWSDAEWHGAAALVAYTAEIEERDSDETPNYD